MHHRHPRAITGGGSGGAAAVPARSAIGSSAAMSSIGGPDVPGHSAPDEMTGELYDDPPVDTGDALASSR
jgi:hypothetical protein